MRLFIAGHNHRKGYAVTRIWSDAECSRLPPATPEEMAPVRFIQNRLHAFKLVERWNQRLATH